MKAQNKYSIGPMPASDILVNVFPIQTDSNSGSSFVIADENEEFIITAKHLFGKKVKSGDEVRFKIRTEEDSVEFKKKVFFDKNDMIDIAVLPLGEDKLQELENYPLGAGGAIIGQDCFFYGYPYWGIHSNLGGTMFPFVKKGILSAVYKEKDTKYFFVDAHNNPGFSGGPVVYYNYIDSEYKVLGVISAYWRQKNIGEISITDSLKSKFSYNENSGIMIVYESQCIKDIIESYK